MTVGLGYFLLVSAAVFAIGCFGLLSRRGALALLMSGELMLTAVSLALVAFGRLGPRAGQAAGGAFAAFVIADGVLELGVGLAMALLIYRQRQTLQLDAGEALGP